MLVQISRDYKITLPSEFMKKTGLEEGGSVECSLHDGRIFLEPPNTGRAKKKRYLSAYLGAFVSSRTTRM